MVGHYLMFNRNCSEALDCYAAAFNGEVREKQCYRDMPPNPAFPIAEEDMDLVLNSRLLIDGAEIMCADSSGGAPAGENMYVSLVHTDEAYIRNAWAVLSDGGKVYLDLAPSFFAKAHGSLQDRYGINWMFTVMDA